MKRLMKNGVCGSREQYMRSTDVAKNELKSQIVRL